VRFPGFVGPTYTLRSVKADCQRCVNLIPELLESQQGTNGEIGYLLNVPGLRRVATVGTGPIRGLYQTSTGRLVVVSGNKLYRVGTDWAATEIGTLYSSTGLVDMADNGTQIICVDGSNGYVVSMADNTFTVITEEAFVGSNRVTFLDGYFVCNNPGTGQFYISALYDGLSWDALDFATAEGIPDHLVCCIANGRQLWAFGTQSVEVYWNSGLADFPMSRVDGSFIEHGCSAAQTVQKVAGTLMWLSDKGQVLQAQGYAAQRISNHSLELAIRQAGDLATSSAWTYAQDGHHYYCLCLPNINATWCYDVTTGQWHERVELVSGAYQPFRVSCAEEVYSVQLAGDNANGKLYALDPDVYTFDGSPIAWERTSPHATGESKRAFVSAFMLDMEVGIGLDGTGQGTDPQVMMQISRDGGFTWNAERWVTAGSIGAYKHRAIWRRCGQGRDMVFRVRGTDPVRTRILGANVDVELEAQ
jgi:Phage stabilisation protein